jgi:pilus assembly protein CpaE
MLHKADIMLIGRSQDAISGIFGLLEEQRLLTLRTHVFGNGHSDIWPNDGEHAMPDAMALCLEEDWRHSLPGMLEALPAIRPPFLVLSPTSDLELLRAAMRAGARDVLSPPYEEDDLATRLVELSREGQLDRKRSSAHLSAFINAKGGSGSSFLSANVASALASRYERKSILIDFDLQFGGLPIYLNMSPGNGLIKALEFIDSLDVAALPGYVQVHGNGLHLLSAAMNNLVLPDDISEERITRLLEVLDTAYQEIIVDLPRRIDRTTAAVLERLDQVFVVTQQSVTHLQDTKRLLSILNDHMGITEDRVLIVLNRFSKKSEVRIEDFGSAFPGATIETVPSDYALVSESINMGVPVAEGSPRSPLAKAILSLCNHVLPREKVEQKHTSGLLDWLGFPGKA